MAPEIASEYERLAKRQGRTKSELFRQMLEAYKAKLEEEEFFRVQSAMARKARKRGVFSEKDIERLVFERR